MCVFTKEIISGAKLTQSLGSESEWQVYMNTSKRTTQPNNTNVWGEISP